MAGEGSVMGTGQGMPATWTKEKRLLYQGKGGGRNRAGGSVYRTYHHQIFLNEINCGQERL